ncbi:type IV pilin [Haloferax sp. AB510]|uniref:type IV pilin n=1 Tax=Haloferax sp. AB510 TaxID=2934172 RepID=UPI00209C4C6F|nr:type IV pilin [Haloferax sp. AB510]MCO8265349.1 type IV pilin [Haloferax sp. AB510]
MQVASRAQSETVGMILLLGLVVVVVTVGGVAALAAVDDYRDDAPLVELDVTVDGSNLTLAHRAGDTLRAGDVAVVTRSEDTTTRYSLGTDGDINRRATTSESQFGPGDSWRPTAPVGFDGSDPYLVLVVHEPSNTVIHRAERTLGAVTETPGPAPTPRPTTTSPPATTTSTATTTATTATTTTTTTTTTPESTAINGVHVEDRTTNSGGAGYRVDYDVAAGPDFDRVRVTFENLDSSWATQTVTETNARGFATYDIGAGVGDRYRITVAALDAGGNVLDSRTISDVADGDNPDANTGLPETNDPKIRGAALIDLTQEGAAYELNYNVTNASNLSEIRVEFDNLDAPSATAELSGTAPRGTIAGYSAYDGTEGDDYEVVIRVFDEDGVLVDRRVISDVADGVDPAGNDDLTRVSSPSFEGTIIDDLSMTQADYEASYNVTDRAEFGRVRLWVSNVDDSYAEGIYESADPRNTIDDFAAEDNGGTFGMTYRIRLQLLDADGVVVDERIVTDDADWTDPSGNDGLSRVGSPSFDSVSVSDNSQTNRNRVRYRVDYEVVGTGEFAEVEVYFRNRQQPQASGVVRSTATSENNLEYTETYGTGDTYDIEVRVVDADGIVVDRYVLSDIAGDKNA